MYDRLKISALDRQKLLLAHLLHRIFREKKPREITAINLNLVNSLHQKKIEKVFWNMPKYYKYVSSFKNYFKVLL